MPGFEDGERIAGVWPLFALRLRTERLELRTLTDDLIPALAELARRGIHRDDVMPFGNGWTDRSPRDWHSGFARYFWAQRGRWTPDSWALPLAVLVDGEPAGVQQVTAEDFPVLRTFGTGSWLARDHQGRGIGTEMRAAALHLGFAGLGGELAVTGAYRFNAASIRVTEKLGYEPNGTRIDRVRDRAEEAVLFRLTREAWAAGDRPQVEIDGLEACLPAFGLDPVGSERRDLATAHVTGS